MEDYHMSVDYQKLYAYLVGKIDDALELLESGDLVKARPIRELLQDALLRAEDSYIEGMAEEICNRILLLPEEKQRAIYWLMEHLEDVEQMTEAEELPEELQKYLAEAREKKQYITELLLIYDQVKREDTKNQ